MKHILITLITLAFIIGCGTTRGTVSNPVVKHTPQPELETAQHAVPQSKLPPAPKKNLTLKKVDDKNYSDKYMYPEDTSAAKKDPVKTEGPTLVKSPTTNMAKEECIAMITQEKFDKYTAMFGSEDASIKRCAMLKAIKK